MMHSSSSNNAVRHRSCTQSPSQSGKDNDNTNAHRNPSGGHGGGNTIGGGCGNVDDENDGSSGSHYGIGGSINDNTTIGTTKLHGRRYSQRPPRWKNIHKTTLVLGMAVTLPTLCLLGMYMSSTSLDSLKIGSSPHFRHGDDVSSKARLGSKHNNIRRGERGGGDEIMEFFERKMKRRKYNDYEPATNSHNDENEEEEEDNDNSIDKDKTDTEFDKEEVQSSRQSALSSHTGGGRIANNSQELQYQYPPRMLRLELQKQFSNKMSGGETDSTRTSRGGKPKLSHGDVLLSTVHRLPTYESRDIPPSERYITPYPDDDGYMDRLESVKKSKKYRNNEREALEDDVCTAKHAWQADAYPNCNLLHEYELGQLTGMFGRALRRNLRKNEGDGDELVKYLASGYWRDVWLLSKASGSFVDGGGSSSITEEANNTPMETNMTIIEKEEITVLKTLRFKHDFTDRNYDRHRKDALASMRMSQSPNVVDIYAYCSNSAVFEYGKGGDIDAKLWPYDKEEEKYYVADIPSLEKVDLAYQVARAIADVHDVEDDGHASIAHTDITPSQFIFINGRWKLNDFNRCRFMRVRKEDGAPCGFYVGANPGKFRAPEEYAFAIENEMVDIYSMGNIFYSILSGIMPFEGQKESKAKKKVLDGIRPKIPDEIKESKDIAIQTLISVTKKCWSKKPKSRPSAASVRDELKELMDQMMMNTTATTKRGERGVTT